MNRFMKFIVTLGVVLIILVAGAALILPKVIDPNNYRGEIADIMHEKTGLTLVINGPIGWSVFPWVGLSLEDISVKSSEGSQLAQLGTAEVSVKLMPLLSKKVEVRTASLNGLELTLVKDENGQGNWEVTIPESSKPVDSSTETASESSSEKPVIELDIASVEVSGLLFSYEDQSTGQKFLVDQASLTTGSIRNHEPVDFDLQARINLPELILISSITGSLNANVPEGIYELNNLDISAYPDTSNPEKLSIVGNIKTTFDPMSAEGHLDVVEFNPKQLLRQLNTPVPLMADESALTALAFNSEFSTNGENFNASKLKLQLDNFVIDGNVNIADLNKQKIVFKFNGNDLNLDRYLPPSGDQQAPGSKDSSGSSKPAQEQSLIPEDMLRDLNLDGSMALTSLTVANLRFDEPSVKLKAASGTQEATIGSGFYKGKIDLNTLLDVRQKNLPKVKAQADMKAINLEALAKSIPELEPVHGLVNASLNVNTKGQLQSELTKSLNGRVQFHIDQGEFTRANFNKMVCEGIAFARQQDLGKDNWSNSTTFNDLSGTFDITNGIARNNNLIAALTNLNLKGDGEINLVQKTLDYHLGMNIRGDESPDNDPACQINEKYVDVTWPVRCEGDMNAPKCGIDSERLGDTIADILRNEAREKIEEQLEKNLQEPVRELFKGLFN